MAFFSRNKKEEDRKKVAEQIAATEKAQKAEKKAESKPAAKAVAVDAYPTHKVIVVPLVTEKGTMLQERGTYVFRVRPEVSRAQVRMAVATAYNVTPVAIRVANYDGKFRRYGRSVGKTQRWKKAFVTLAEGQKIDLTSL